MNTASILRRATGILTQHGWSEETAPITTDDARSLDQAILEASLDVSEYEAARLALTSTTGVPEISTWAARHHDHGALVQALYSIGDEIAASEAWERAIAMVLNTDVQR